LSDLLQLQKKPEISTPYDPVHLTHVGFNSDTGEFTGLPKEWQQLLQDSGISKQDQEANPQAVMDIVAFYQDAQKAQLGAEDSQVWKKMGGVANGQPTGPVEK
ncbi:PBD-domain-containing protein, partial [Wallemia mellicola CBS 633.66]